MIQEHSYGIVPLREREKQVEVLLIAHKGGRHWGFPKGRKDPGESDLAAAKRELEEETGLSVSRLLSEEPYQESYTFYKFHERVKKTVRYFPAFVQGILKIQPEEIIDARWIPLKEAHLHLTFKESQDICVKVQKIL